MRILVSGGDGQVGWEIKCQSEKYQHDVIALGCDDLDVLDTDSIGYAIVQYKPDVIINAAAYTAVDRAEKESDMAYRINCEGARNLAQSCNAQNIPIIQFSTDYVFNGEKSSPYLENDKTSPLGVYGKSKLAGETAIIEVIDKYIILRTSWVFGTHGNNFVKTILKLASERDSLNIVEDQFGTPTSAKSLANSTLKICDFIKNSKQVKWGVYHYSGAPCTNWYEFSKYIIKAAYEIGILDRMLEVLPIVTEQYPTLASRPKYSCLSSNLAKQVFMISPSDWRNDLEEMLLALMKEHDA